MARDDDNGDSGRWRDTLFILLVIVALAALWIISGGAKRGAVNLFIQPPFSASIPFEESVYEGEPYAEDYTGEISSEVSKVKEALEKLSEVTASGNRGRVYIDSTGDAEESDPFKESIVIRADSGNRQVVAITGWHLASSMTGRSVDIGKGVSVLVLGRGGEEGAILLKPGETATISTGRSPVGTSFRVNVCSGYLAQFQSFTPELSLMCPSPRTETSLVTGDLGDSCYDLIETIPRCRIELDLPGTLSEECRGFITKNLTYNGCVENHRDERGFERPEWRIYLGRSEELWKERYEVIQLLDEAGNLVDSATY